MNEIKILSFKIVNDGLLKGLCDIKVNGWVIKYLRITQHEGREPYLVMSKGNVIDLQTGRPHMEQTVFMPTDLWPEVERVVLAKFEEEKSKNDGSNTTKTNN